MLKKISFQELEKGHYRKTMNPRITTIKKRNYEHLDTYRESHLQKLLVLGVGLVILGWGRGVIVIEV